MDPKQGILMESVIEYNNRLWIYFIVKFKEFIMTKGALFLKIGENKFVVS